MHFNMNRTWSQATALVRANFQLLAVVAGVFLLLPSLLFAILMPDTPDWMRLGQNPEAMAEAMGGSIVPLALYGLAGALLQLVGYGAMIALVGGARPTVGEAIGHGARSLLTAIGAVVLFVFAYLAAMLIASLIAAAIAAAVGAVAGSAAGAMVTLILFGIVFVAVLYVVTRLSLTLAVVVLEGQRNPVAALRRSWALTRPHGWPIFGFYVLLAIAYFVISLLLFGLTGAVGAAFGGGAFPVLFAGLVSGIVSAFVAMVVSSIWASMHQQLAGPSGEALRGTFD